ncbi:MAG: FxLYD domain-containing protein [Planctomycetota bacterium]
MATPRNVCHRCRHKWKVKKNMAPECPKCGWDNIGPTDPAPSPLPKLAVIALLALLAAWKLGLLPGSAVKQAQDALKDAQGAVKDLADEVEKKLPQGEKTKSAEESKTAAKTETPERPQPEPKKTPKPEPKAGADAPPRPDVVVTSKLGAPTGSAYMVRGKLKNQGQADAHHVRVRVTFQDKDGATLDEVDAECPSDLAAGKTSRFEAAVAGEKAKRVEAFKAQVSFEE